MADATSSTSFCAGFTNSVPGIKEFQDYISLKCALNEFFKANMYVQPQCTKYLNAMHTHNGIIKV